MPATEVELEVGSQFELELKISGHWNGLTFESWELELGLKPRALESELGLKRTQTCYNSESTENRQN